MRSKLANGLVKGLYLTRACSLRREQFSSARIDVQSQLESANDFSSIVKLCLKRSHAFNHIQLSIAFNKIAKLFVPTHSTHRDSAIDSTILDGATESEANRANYPVWLVESMLRLSRRAKKINPLLGPAEISSIIHSYAKVLQRPSYELLACLSHRGVVTIQEFTPQSVSIVMWAFATLGLKPDPLFLVSMQNRAFEISHQFDSQNISNYFWAHATLSLSGDRSLTRLADEAERRILEFSFQESINLLWSFAKLKVRPSPQLLLGIQDNISNSVDSLDGQNISQFLWSAAKLDVFPGQKLMKEMSDRIQACLTSMSPQSVSNTFWAFSCFKEKFPPPLDLIRDLGNHTARNIDLFNPQSLCTVLQFHAKLVLNPSDHLLVSLSAQCVHMMPDFNSHDVSMLLWSFAKLRISPDAVLVSALISRAGEEMPSFKSQEVSNLVWSLAKMISRNWSR